MSIEELDATVRAFYEGRGDTVRFVHSFTWLKRWQCS